MSLPPNFWPDSLRTVIFAAYALMSGQIVAVIFYYLRAYRAARRTGAPGAGLLPLHVWAISISFWLLATECAVFTYGRVGKPLIAWGMVNLFVFTLSAFALHVILRYERRRVPQPRLLLLHLKSGDIDIPPRADRPIEVVRHHGDAPRGCRRAS